MGADNQIDYIEFQAADLGATRAFFEQLFGWKFTDLTRPSQVSGFARALHVYVAPSPQAPFTRATRSACGLRSMSRRDWSLVTLLRSRAETYSGARFRFRADLRRPAGDLTDSVTLRVGHPNARAVEDDPLRFVLD